jgi:predicted acetyltransferase
MVKMGLEVCEDMGIKRVLVTCNKDNVSSAKTMIANGGVFQNDFTEDNGTIIKRY